MYLLSLISFDTIILPLFLRHFNVKYMYVNFLCDQYVFSVSFPNHRSQLPLSVPHLKSLSFQIPCFIRCTPFALFLLHHSLCSALWQWSACKTGLWRTYRTLRRWRQIEQRTYVFRMCVDCLNINEHQKLGAIRMRVFRPQLDFYRLHHQNIS
jgi:hypothetical protein